jgi:hypothetical protein
MGVVGPEPTVRVRHSRKLVRMVGEGGIPNKTTIGYHRFSNVHIDRTVQSLTTQSAVYLDLQVVGKENIILLTPRSLTFDEMLQ